MENILKKPYEISIWEDFTPDEDKKYYQERKLMIIGSSQMTSELRAVQPVLKENVNGTHTLTFTLYNKYFDEDVGDFVDNPFLPYMVNERKVKLFYDGDWYDFIIKEVREKSDSKSFEYTCTDSFINELSKNGFSIELDTELENNQGTIGELATAILDGTDWKLGHVDTLVQKNDEPLYAVKIPAGTSIVGTDMSTLMNLTPTTITISSKPDLTGVEVERIIYVFYSSAMDNTIPMQFLYREDGNYTVDEDGVINNAPNYLLTEGTIKVNIENGATNEFRGKRIVQKEITKYDSLTDHFVTAYEDSNKKELYMYYENEYISPTITTNFVANSINFVNSSGWVASSPNTIKNIIYPSMYDLESYENTNFVPYMRLKFNEAKPIYNAGIISNVSFFTKGIAAGEEFVLRLKYGVSSSEDGKPTKDLSNKLRAKVAKYNIDDNGNYTFDGSQEILSFVYSTPRYENDIDPYSDLDYVYYIAQANQSVSYSDLKSTKSPIGLFFTLDTPDSNNYYFIQEAQFFLYKLDQKNNMVIPNGDAPESCVKKKYFYYYPEENKNLVAGNDVKYAYIGNEKSPNYTVKYDKTFEKIRSITAKESNRFNLIQTLCETFECWPKFEIDHEPNGAITIGPNGPQKRLNFYEYVGQDNYSGFRYGINLKTIERTLDSEQIVSKIIVKPNSNEYGIDGYCDIARASENPIKENFLLNFRYYIQQGLLDGNEVNNDLYLYTENGKYLGYYVQLNKINKEYDSYITELSLISVAITNIESSYTAFKEAYNAAVEELNIRKNTIQNFCGVSYESLLADTAKYSRYLGNEEVQSLIQEIQSLGATAKQQQTYYLKKELELQQQMVRREEILKLQEELRDKKEELNYKFYQKYSKYIQEGSWISEDYMDDNLYYLDAENVLYTSAFPEVSYTINVIELSQLEGYENYKFSVGDKTYIEDVEFFGYKSIDSVKTPYQEEVILSEITYNLDSPESNQIKVQNYKTQFEDLFQRITATTQSLQYQTGNYQKAASAFNSDGSLTQSSLQNSMINNSLILSNATDQSVVWDETGITITNLAKPNEIVRLVSGGILITSNGGDTWSAGITGNGINTSYLTAGQIDASKINIMNGSFPSFRWDANGLSAYRFEIDKTTQTPVFFNFNNFVRFDQFGIYGINHDSDFKAESVEQIKEFAKFGLTWDGFFLKSDHNKDDAAVDGRIEISTDNDFQVIDGRNKERIKIGLLDIRQNDDGKYEGHYGIRISDKSGEPVMATNDDGMLWLTKKIVIGPDYALDDRYYRYRAQLGIIDTWEAFDKTSPLKQEDSSGNVIYPTVPHSLIFSVKGNADNNNDTIAIYDTGTFYAEDAFIKGRIEAESGKIGNLDIQSLSENMSRLTIEANTGITIKETTDGKLAPEQMKFTPKVTGIDTSKAVYVNWQYSQSGNVSDFHDLPNSPILMGTAPDDDGNMETGDGVLNISSSEIYSRFNRDGIVYLKAVINQDGRRYEDVEILTLLKDANIEGIDLDIYNIQLNYPEILKYWDKSEDNNETLTFSPGEMVIKSYKGQEDDRILDESEIDYELYIYSSETNFYSDENNWVKLNGQIKEIVYNANTDTYIDTGNLISSPFNQFTEFSSNTIYRVKIDDFYKYSISLSENTRNYFYQTINNIFKDENTSIKINLIKKNTSEILATTFCNLKFGTSADMATFALTAAGIEAAVRNTGLKFDTEGLHIINGGFEIINEEAVEDEEGNIIVTKEDLFKIVDGELVMVGNGTFSGTIHATDGEFSGLIYANGGTLENLDVTGLINVGDNLVINGSATEENPNIGFYSKNYISDNDTGFFIGNDGTIIANQLTLGTGANIKKYIRLGDAWIINPTWLNNELSSTEQDPIVKEYNLTGNSFITVKEPKYVYNDENEVIQTIESPKDLISIKQNGIITIGKNNGIRIDGTNESIQSFNYNDNSNYGWSITPEEATFYNIKARGSLESSTFEYSQGAVQTIGGVLLVKPSSAIKDVKLLSNTQLDITTENEVAIDSLDDNGNITNFIKIGHQKLADKLFSGVNSSTEKNHIIVYLDSPITFNPDELKGCPLINMGGISSPSIVINGSESNVPYPKSSISIFENGITTENGVSTLNPEIKLVLGQMPNSIANKTYGIFNSTSYGLYAENVFLKGALISEGKTEQQDFMYSGMNTNSTVEFSDRDKNNFKTETGKIILWAGAPNKDDGSIDIQNAKFKVDNFGNLFANSGYFEGTIITNATITASQIRTAIIEGYPIYDEEGNETGRSTALSIRNADIGIKFDGDTGTIMELGTNGLNLYKDLTVGGNFTIKEDSSLTVPITFFRQTKNKEKITIVGPNQVGFINTDRLDYMQSEWQNDENGNNNIEFDSYLSNLEDGLGIFEKGVSVAAFNNESVVLKQNTRIGGEMLTFYDEKGDRIKWQTVKREDQIIGYDLYLI